MVPLELTQSVFVDFSLQFHGKFCSIGDICATWSEFSDQHNSSFIPTRREFIGM